MCSNEPMSIKGFSWDANDVDPPIPNPPDDAPGAQGWGRSRNQVPPLHRPNQYYGEYYSHPPGPGVNGPSTSSVPMSIASMPREQSLAGNPLALASTAESASTGSFEEPKSKSQYPTTPMHAVNQWQQHPAAYQRSSASHSDEKVQEAWAKRRYGDGDQGDYRQTRSADHNYRSSGASTNTNMDYKANQWHSGNDRNLGYDAQYNNGGPSNEYMNRWDEYRNGYHYPPDGRVSHADAMYNHSHAGQQQWVTSPNRYSSTQGSYPTHPGHPRSPSQPHQQHHATNYTNSADNGSYTTSGNHQQFDQTYPDAIPKHHSPLRRTGLDFESPNESESSCSPSRSIPRPQAIKRDTSNQNENYETKSQIKRMNRQRSIGSKRQSSMSSLGKVSENDMHNLGRHLRQSSIGINDNVPDMHPALEKANGIGLHDRELTIDQFDPGDHIEGKSSPLDEVKSDRPKPIAYSNRGTSLESIKLDEVLGIMSKPAGLGDSDRLGTLGTLDSNDFDTAKVAI
jgi:hypothetical protein